MFNVTEVLLLIFVAIASILIIFDNITWVVIMSTIFGIGTVWGVEMVEYAGINLGNKGKPFNGTCGHNDTCSVCNGRNCSRHRQSIHDIHVKVPRDFDAALQDLLERILGTYVRTWYTDFSSNEAFIQQLRLLIATAVRNIVGRVLRIKWSDVISNRLVPIALEHAQDWRILSEKARKRGGKPEDYVTNLGHKIHPAAHSRDAEVDYLKGLVTGILPHLLPNIYICTNNKVILREILVNWVLLPAMDALSDPNNINFLVKFSTQCESFSSNDSDSLSVPILQSWITPLIVIQPSEHPFKPSLDQVLNDPRLLYLFMQHIKAIGPVNLLQFCLDIDDLSKRMLNPDMTEEIESILYNDVKNMYTTYLDPRSSEYLNLPWYISQGIREILETGSNNIQELRTSRPIYQAHQEAHALLEAVCLPSFQHSYELYNLLCGAPAISHSSSVPTPSGVCGSGGVSTRLGNHIGKIRGILRASTVDGSAFETPDVFQAEEVDCSTRALTDGSFCDEKCSRDLTAWRVTVPHVDGGGSYPLYMVAIHSVSEDKTWTVLRRDQDFYTLRARLMEFHGDKEISDSHLPTRKNQHVSLMANRLHYQDFLQKLLVKPTLRNSELLYTYLTMPDLKPYYTNYNTPDIGFLYQSVAHKLRKEKGQHLDKFMNIFLASTSVEHEHVNLGIDPISDQYSVDSTYKRKDLQLGQFSDNLNLSNCDLPYIISEKLHVTGACFCIAEAVESLSKVSSSVSTLFWMVASLSRSHLDPIINQCLDELLSKLLGGGRAAVVVKLLHDVIFEPRPLNKSTSREWDEMRYNNAREGLYSLIPWWCIGTRTKFWYKIIDSFLESLQSAPFNKHLAYILIDQIVATIFPDISG